MFKKQVGELGVDWAQQSTKRAAVWLILVGVGLAVKLPVDQILLLASGVVQGMGLVIKD